MFEIFFEKSLSGEVGEERGTGVNRGICDVKVGDWPRFLRFIVRF